MSKAIVNMIPNPSDIQTIHCSQGDTEAREWEFELHNNGEVIDAGGITEQMVFKSYKGGTEQILPVNGSTPTTSPFKGDIRYPQGLLSDQEFLYRESPTEEDGLAKITDIKGNTLNWNQLMENGNFADTSKWSAESGATLSISNNIATVSSTTANNGIRQYFSNPLTVNHKYLIKAEFNVPTEYRCVIGTAANQGVQVDKLISTANTWTEVIGIGTCTVATTTFYCFVRGTTYENVKVRNVMCFDLTQMGLDITDPSDFTSLFSLPYYAYNQGTLLSFNGEQIKAIGKNLFDLSQFANGTITFENGVLNGTGAQFHTAYGTYATAKKLNCPKGSQITISFDAWTDQNATSTGNGLIIATYHYDGTHEDAMVPNATGTPRHFTLQRQDIEKIGWSYGTQGANRWHVKNFQIEFGTTETSYEPYTESITDLPISQYFPNGMDGVGDAYDELTENKAITRMRRIDLSTLSFFYNSSNGFFTATIPDLVTGMTYATESPNVIVQGYEYKGGGVGWANMPDMSYGFNGQDMRIKNTAYTTTADFTNAVRGTYMVYELDTYEEISFTTASLVTENAEIPLSNEDGVLVGKCNSDVSADAGFIEGKIKLSDEDGDVYSNKIQIHVERSPQ